MGRIRGSVARVMTALTARELAVSALALALLACTSQPPPAPTGTSLPGSSLLAPTASAGQTLVPGSAPPTASDAQPTGTPMPTLPEGSRLGIRYSGSPGVEFQGLITARFDDGQVVPRDASGHIDQEPITQGLGETIVAVRVSGTIVSRRGTYRVEIVAGHLQAGIFVADQVLAADEATGRDGEVLVDYGNVDL